MCPNYSFFELNLLCSDIYDYLINLFFCIVHRSYNQRVLQNERVWSSKWVRKVAENGRTSWEVSDGNLSPGNLIGRGKKTMMPIFLCKGCTEQCCAPSKLSIRQSNGPYLISAPCKIQVIHYWDEVGWWCAPLAQHAPVRSYIPLNQRNKNK